MLKDCGLFTKIKAQLKLHILLNQIRRKAKAQEIASPVGFRLLRIITAIKSYLQHELARFLRKWLSTWKGSDYLVWNSFSCVVSF